MPRTDGKRQQRLNARIPGQLIFLNIPRQRIAGEVMVLVRPLRRIGDLVGKRSRGQNLG